MTTLEVLKTYPFEERLGSAMIVREPVGVVGMITPWNWPLNQIACKVAPALAAGCTMILKPSENTPSSALIFAEILDEAGVPKGVFNLVNGLGEEAGDALVKHPDVPLISFTGESRTGQLIFGNAAPFLKGLSIKGLMVVGGAGKRNKDGRLPSSGDLGHSARARAADDQIGIGKRTRHVGDECRDIGSNSRFVVSSFGCGHAYSKISVATLPATSVRRKLRPA